MKEGLRHGLLAVAVGAIVFLTNLGGVRLWDRDEPRNAGCAAEMLARGDWVVPVFNAELRAHKPVLPYWLMMASYSVFGVNEFAARFGSALCGLATVLATYAIGRRLFNAQAGLWAAVVLASTLMFGVAARAATPDAPLIFCITAALLVYVYAAFPASTSADTEPTPAERYRSYYPQSRWTLVLMYGLMGLAMLAKGPVGLVIPMAIVGMFLLIMRLPERTETAAGKRSLLARALGLLRPFAPGHFLRTAWSMKPLTALVVALAVALPWYVWVGVRTQGAFLEEFFFTHNFGRAMQSMEGHRGPFFYYLVALFVGFTPWSVFFGSVGYDAALRIRRREPRRPALIFLCCWVGVFLGVFSMAQTKLPNYITPAYPAAALIVGAFVERWTASALRISSAGPRGALRVYALVGLGLIVGLGIAAHVVLPGEEWVAAVGLIPLAGATAALVLLRRRGARAAATAFAVSAVLFTTTAFALVAQRVDRHQPSGRMLAAIHHHSATDTPAIVAYGCQEPSWIYYAKQPIPLIHGEQATEVLDFLSQGPDRFVITSDDHYARIRDRLPDDVVLLAQDRYFLRTNKTLMVLGRAGAVVADRRAAQTGNLIQ